MSLVVRRISAWHAVYRKGVIHVRHEQLDSRLMELGKVAADIEALQEKEQELRKEVFGIIENEGLTDGYRNELATVSYVERKTLNIKDQEKLIADLQRKKLVKYYSVVPEKVIPEHVELTKDFEKDLKADAFEHPEVEVKTASNLAVRFNK